MKLLFAEDTEDLNRVVKAMFEHAGYSVDAVFDGEAALESVEKNGYDAVILDIMMPKRDGISVLRAMRERAATSSVSMRDLRRWSSNSVTCATSRWTVSASSPPGRSSAC